METRQIKSFNKKTSKKGPYYEVELDNGIVGLCFNQNVPNLTNIPLQVTLRAQNDTTFVNIDEKSVGTSAPTKQQIFTKEKNTSAETMVLAYMKDLTVAMINKDMFTDKDAVTKFLGGEFVEIYSFFVNMVKNQN